MSTGYYTAGLSYFFLYLKKELRPFEATIVLLFFFFFCAYFDIQLKKGFNHLTAVFYLDLLTGRFSYSRLRHKCILEYFC